MKTIRFTMTNTIIAADIAIIFTGFKIFVSILFSPGKRPNAVIL